MEDMSHRTPPPSRRAFLLTAAAAATAAVAVSPTLSAQAPAAAPGAGKIILPPTGKRLLLSCKLGMITKERNGEKLTLTQRLGLAGEAGFDGVDLDEAASFQPDEARAAVIASGVFCHNAINHAHWSTRLTDPKPETRAQARANLEHCIRVAHAIGGSGVLIVVGRGDDGPAEEIEERCRNEMKQVLPLAAALGQPILIENVWNQMMYDHGKPADQTPDRFVKFVDSFKSPWIGMYYDIGNHWKYGQPGEWIRAFGHRCVKLDVKGFSRAKDAFVDITSPDDDLPWDQVRRALADIGFSGWATAEVGGGDVPRLKVVREQMQKAFGV